MGWTSGYPRLNTAPPKPAGLGRKPGFTRRSAFGSLVKNGMPGCKLPALSGNHP
jgi:hypothetical protein